MRTYNRDQFIAKNTCWRGKFPCIAMSWSATCNYTHDDCCPYCGPFHRKPRGRV